MVRALVGLGCRTPRRSAGAERAEAEAALARQLLADLRLPREREGAGGGRRQPGRQQG
ncbi:conserved hypothetical protein [Cupriavidus taiwanensis]|nr:conserved hypothetical protein [Cupriavidus taiwanensis]